MRSHNAMTRRAKRATCAIAAAAVLAVTTLVAPAHAADAVVIRKVNTTDPKTVELTVLKPPVSSSNADIRISENGKVITNAEIKSIGEADVPVGVVLVLDMSDGMKNSDAATKVKEAAVAMVQAKKPNEKFAIVATNGTARPVANFTDDTTQLVDLINALQPSSQNALWSGVSMAAGLLSDAPQLQPNVVVVAGSADQISKPGVYTTARSQLRAAKAVAFTLAIRERNNVNVENLKDLAAQTGGRYIETADSSTSTQILTGLGQNLNDQAVIRYASLGGKALDISVVVGNGVATAHASPGTISEGVNVAPAQVGNGGGPKILSGQFGVVVVGAISLAFVALLLYGLIQIASTDRHQLSRALRPYADDVDDRSDISRLADSEIIKKAVAATAKAANDRGLLEVVQRRLEQADLPLRPAEALFFTGVISLVAMLVGAVTFGILGMFGAFLVTLWAPVFITNVLAKRRRKKFTGQLPDTLQLLAGSMRAGYSLVQGLDAVSKQAEAPMGSELQRAMAEARLGRPVEEALQEVSDRMGSDDFEWAVMAIKIQREVGGNLAELLMTVGETMVARERLRREVKALTAEGRVSAIVLSILPPAIGGIITLLNPVYMQPLFTNTMGKLALVVAALMIGFGYWLMMKMVEIET